MSETKTPVKKGNKTTELIIGSAAAKVEAAVKSLLNVAPEVAKLQTTINQSTLEVVNLEDKIGSLKQDYANKVAQNKIEIEQQFKADEKAFVDNWMRSNGMTCLPAADLSRMKTDLTEATQNVQETVNKAVNAATSAMKKDHDNATAMAKLEFEKKEADNKASIVQLTDKVEFLEEQVSYWKQALEEERKAGVERAKASSIGTLNVGTPR